MECLLFSLSQITRGACVDSDKATRGGCGLDQMWNETRSHAKAGDDNKWFLP